MYGYRRSLENGMMTNLDSISSSLSSIDTVGQPRRGNGHSHSNKTSIENLISQRSAYAGTNSTGLLWNRHAPKEDLYSATTTINRDGVSRTGDSDIYYSRGKKPPRNYCPNSATTTNMILIPFLLLTTIRQVFDFLGQVWLQIIINFFTIIFTIVAFFGIKQNRISYLLIFTLTSIFNAFWNLVVISIHFKASDSNEDLLSLYTGAKSWWHTNGPGCLPYSISNLQPSINIESSIMSGCRLDYHLIEATQASIHCALSFLSAFACCWLMFLVRCHPDRLNTKQPNSDRLYRMNDLTNNHKINQDPFPGTSSVLTSAGVTNSLRRSVNHKPSSRSSQHSMSSVRSTRRRRALENGANMPSTPRGSRSSVYRSSKYGSLSSRRSYRHRESANDASSSTYGSIAAKRTGGSSRRTRLSSVSSTEYLPSYQPPHSSNANLLSPYGEISSIDSYNNNTTDGVNGVNGTNGTNGTKEFRTKNSFELRGNANPVYQGSRSSVCSQNMNNDNYDDISYIYGGNGSIDNPYGQRGGDRARRQKIYSQLRNGHSNRPTYPNSVPEEIPVETHRTNENKNTAAYKDIGTNGSTFLNGGISQVHSKQ